MKKIFTLLAILIVATAFAQVPQKMSYQAVIRNASNALVVNAPVSMRISLILAAPTGPVVYAETQNVVTNANGLVSLEIGNGTVVSGDFFAIDWSLGVYFIQTETDPAGGTNYSITATSQLLTVPFAMYAQKTAFSDLKHQSLFSTIPSTTVRKATVFASNSLTVQEAGTYLLTFYVNGFDGEGGVSSPNFDVDCNAFVYNETFGTNVTSQLPFVRYITDTNDLGGSHYNISTPGSYSNIIFFNANTVLRCGASVQSVGTPTAAWRMNEMKLNIVKIAN